MFSFTMLISTTWYITFFLKRSYCWLAGWLFALCKYATESLDDRSIGESLTRILRLLLQGVKPQYRRSELNNNPLSHCILLRFSPLGDTVLRQGVVHQQIRTSILLDIYFATEPPAHHLCVKKIIEAIRVIIIIRKY